MKTTHTPGPWALDSNGIGHEVVLGRGGQHCVAAVHGTDDPAENLANGRLIASAPELLEAARDAIHMIQCIAENWPEQVGILSSFREATHVRGIRVPSVQDRLASAIAKAEGN